METRLRQRMKKFHYIVEHQNPDHQVTIHKLNDDCLTNIFTFLQIVDRVRIESVCKHWRYVSQKSWQSIKTLDRRLAILGFDIYYTIPRPKAIEIYKNVLQRCGPFLRRLDLSYLLTDKYILHSFSKLCQNLQNIDMEAVDLTLPALKALTKNCRNLKVFTFSISTKEVNDEKMSKFFKQTKQLKSLQIIKNTFLTGDCLLSLPVDMEAIFIEYCSCISIYCVSNKLTIIEVDLVTDAFLGALAANCKKLYHLDINRCNNVTDVGVQKVTRLPKIEYLSLGALQKITDSALTYIPNLKELHCWYGRNIKDNGICTLLETCDSIEFLDLSFCPQITNTLVECATNVTKNRTNNVVLHLQLSHTSVDVRNMPKETPLLKIF